MNKSSVQVFGRQYHQGERRLFYAVVSARVNMVKVIATVKICSPDICRPCIWLASNIWHRQKRQHTSEMFPERNRAISLYKMRSLETEFVFEFPTKARLSRC